MTKTKKELQQLIDQETEESEKHRDEPLVRGKRRSGTRMEVYSIRLAPEQIEQIERIADEAGVTARGLVQRWVLDGLAAHGDDSPATTIARIAHDIQHLQQQLAS